VKYAPINKPGSSERLAVALFLFSRLKPSL